MDINHILGYKISQSQMFDQKGERIPVTRILAGPSRVVNPKKQENNVWTVQLTFGTARKINQSKQGFMKKAGLEKAPLFVKSAKINSAENLANGQEIKLEEVFQSGDTIKITGISKGKGFAGVVKRHGFHGGPKTHGQSDRHRAPGAIGSTTTPGRVYRGKRMAGHMGQEKVTIRGLKVMSVDAQNYTMVVKGLVPGAINGLLYLSKQG